MSKSVCSDHATSERSQRGKSTTHARENNCTFAALGVGACLICRSLSVAVVAASQSPTNSPSTYKLTPSPLEQKLHHTARHLVLSAPWRVGPRAHTHFAPPFPSALCSSFLPPCVHFSPLFFGDLMHHLHLLLSSFSRRQSNTS